MQDNYTEHIKYIEETATKITCAFCPDKFHQEDMRQIYLTHQYICKTCIRTFKKECWDIIAPDGITEEEKESVLKQLRA